MLRLSLPVVLTYLGLMTMGTVDLFFVGKIGPASVGAVGVGTSLFGWIMVFGLGMLAGLDYLISHSYGAKKFDECHQSYTHGVLLALAMGVPLTFVLLGFAQLLSTFGINPEVVPQARAYLTILSFSLIPIYVFSASQRYLQAVGWVDPAFLVLLTANLLNFAINSVLVPGRFGFPAMGVQGTAIATLTSRIFMCTSMFGFVFWWDRRNHRKIRFKSPIRFLTGYDRAVLGKILKLGSPSAAQMMFEVGVFGLSTVLAARLTSENVAAHQIVLNIASLTFMIPLGLSSATAVLVGQAVGKQDAATAARTGWQGLALGTGFMAVACVVLFVDAQSLLSFYTNAAGVIDIAKKIIVVAALFQLSDGAQVVATGALRGIADTRSPMFANMIGHWCIGLPVGIFLCFYLKLGLIGLWIGLSLGLTLIAIALVWVWAKKTRAGVLPIISAAQQANIAAH